MKYTNTQGDKTVQNFNVIYSHPMFHGINAEYLLKKLHYTKEVQHCKTEKQSSRNYLHHVFIIDRFANELCNPNGIFQITRLALLKSIIGLHFFSYIFYVCKISRKSKINSYASINCLNCKFL